MSRGSAEGRAPVVLSDDAARRLLIRASELDAASAGGYALADLRAAAAEAGISAPAFETALAESRDATEPGRVPSLRAISRLRWRLAAAAATAAGVLLGVGALVLSRERARTVATVEQTILLRCLSGPDAATLLVPLVRNDGVSGMLTAPGSRVLTIRTTPAQMARLRAALQQYETAGSAACPVPPSDAPPP